MRKLFPILLLFLLVPVSGVEYYPILSTEVHIELMKLNTSLINTTSFEEQLDFLNGTVTASTTTAMSLEVEGYLEGHKTFYGNDSCYNWEDLSEIGRRTELINPSLTNVLLVANLPCKNDPLGCFCGVNETLKVYTEPSLAMAEVDLLLSNATNSTEMKAVLDPLLLELLSDIVDPPMERINFGQSPMMIGSEFEIIFLLCGANADIGNVVDNFEQVLPDDIVLSSELISCTELQYGNFITSDDKGVYLFSNPSLLKLDDFTDTSKIPIVLINSLEEFEIVDPFFAIRAQDEDFTEAQVMELIARYFGLEQRKDPNSVSNGAGEFDEIDLNRINLIFESWRNEIQARDSLLKIGLIKRLNSSMYLGRIGSLNFYRGFTEIYRSIINDFKFGRYSEVTNSSDILLNDFKSQGYWNNLVEEMVAQVSEIEGYENCMECGQGCYGAEGICCESTFYVGGRCCGGDCGFAFSCENNQCVFNWGLIMMSLISSAILVVPPFILIFIVLFSHRNLKHWRIKKEFRKMKDLGLKDDKAYFKLFQKGYKKKDLKDAMGYVKKEKPKPKNEGNKPEEKK
jgi:hypothetical protein